MTSPQQVPVTATGEIAGRKPRNDEIDVYGVTHPGKVRQTNNDHFLVGAIQQQLEVKLTSLTELERQELVAQILPGQDTGDGSSKLQKARHLRVLDHTLDAGPDHHLSPVCD